MFFHQIAMGTVKYEFGNLPARPATNTPKQMTIVLWIYLQRFGSSKNLSTKLHRCVQFRIDGNDLASEVLCGLDHLDQRTLKKKNLMQQNHISK
jgi:hypothetical protein